MRHRLSQTEVEHYGVAFLLDSHRVGGGGCVVGYGELHRVGEVARYAGCRTERGSLGGLDGRNECLEICTDRYGYGYRTCLLVNDAHIVVVQHERQYTCLVMLDAEFVIQIHITVGNADNNRRGHIHFVALLEVGCGTGRQSQSGDSHLAVVVYFGNPDNHGAGCMIHHAGIDIVHHQRLNQAITAYREGAVLLVATGCRYQKQAESSYLINGLHNFTIHIIKW